MCIVNPRVIVIEREHVIYRDGMNNPIMAGRNGYCGTFDNNDLAQAYIAKRKAENYLTILEVHELPPAQSQLESDVDVLTQALAILKRIHASYSDKPQTTDNIIEQYCAWSAAHSTEAVIKLISLK